MKRSKINKPSVLQEFTNLRPHRMDVIKTWHHFWESQAATTRYSWMGTWCRHNLWSFGWMDAAPLDDWRRHLGDWMRHSMLSTWIWLLFKLSCHKQLFVETKYVLVGYSSPAWEYGYSLNPNKTSTVYRNLAPTATTLIGQLTLARWSMTQQTATSS